MVVWNDQVKFIVAGIDAFANRENILVGIADFLFDPSPRTKIHAAEVLRNRPAHDRQRRGSRPQQEAVRRPWRKAGLAESSAPVRTG